MVGVCSFVFDVGLFGGVVLLVVGFVLVVVLLVVVMCFCCCVWCSLIGGGFCDCGWCFAVVVPAAPQVENEQL